MSRQLRSRLLAAALAVAVTVVTGAALTSPVAASSPQTFLFVWGGDNDTVLGPWAGMGIATRPLPVALPFEAGLLRSGQTGCETGYALTTAGQIFAWGENTSGELGAGTGRPRVVNPVKVRLPSGVQAVSVQPGCQHVVALLSTGKVVAWGHGFEGELGDGGSSDRFSPVPVGLPASLRLAAVCAGDDFSLALSTEGRVYAWGDNHHGQSGDGTHLRQHPDPVPVKLASRTQVTAIACGDSHALALTSAGRVLAWGEGRYGALGAGQPGDSPVPVPVRLPASVRIRALFAGRSTSMALSTTGQVWTWGDNRKGQLGNGSTFDQSRRPVRVRLPAGTTVRQISGTSQTDLVLTSRGTILTWGANDEGQLSIGRVSDNSRVPVAVRLPRRQVPLSVFGGNDAVNAPNSRSRSAAVWPRATSRSLASPYG
jgi:alpha-tubulin suppressor-like RCC1 family protein